MYGAMLEGDSILARGQVGLLPLIAFTEDGKSLATVEAAANAVQERAPAGDMAELELLLALFSALNLGTEPVMGLIRRLFMNREILEESPLYHLLVQQATEQAIAQGMAQSEDAACGGCAAPATWALWRADRRCGRSSRFRQP